MEVLKRYHHIVPKWEETSSFEDGEEHSTEHSIMFSTCEGWGALNRKYFGCEMTNHSIWFVLTPILAFDPTGRMIRGGTYFNIPGGKMSLRYSLRLWSQRNNWDARLYYIILVAFENFPNASICQHLLDGLLVTVNIKAQDYASLYPICLEQFLGEGNTKVEELGKGEGPKGSRGEWCWRIDWEKLSNTIRGRNLWYLYIYIYWNICIHVWIYVA